MRKSWDNVYFLGDKAYSFLGDGYLWSHLIKERSCCVLRNGIVQSVEVEVGSSSLLGWMPVVTVSVNYRVIQPQVLHPGMG